MDTERNFNFAQMYGGTADDLKPQEPMLRKSRARLMREAVRHDEANKGFLKIKYGEGIFDFYFRGTHIMQWNIILESILEINAGEFEETTGTFYQRKMLHYAIKEYADVML